MPTVAAVGRALPPHRYEQDELIAAFAANWGKEHQNTERVAQLHRAVQVGGRNLALPMADYLAFRHFGDSNDAWIRVATDIGEAALREALDGAGLLPQDLDALFFTTVTGVAAPTIDARLHNRLGLRTDLKRTPMFGLGCVAGVAGINRVADYLRAWPDQIAALLSVELCSLTLQKEDLSIANLIASGLFGDGAAAVILVGAERARKLGLTGPRVVAGQSRFYPDTERVMGWDIGARGFKIVLSASVPDVVRTFMPDDVDGFLASQGRTRQNIDTWVCHPGGPKVLETMSECLGLPEGALDLTWASLRDVGNLSSSSVLFVLRDTIDQGRLAAGQTGLMLAMGPGFCSELTLLQG
jgi:alkylresorcinol/alkylpyrone synthase